MLAVTASFLASCDPPAPSITLDGQEYRTTSAVVPRPKLGGGIPGVTAGLDVAAVRRIGGVDPREAFAFTHDNPECSREAPGDWLLTYRVDLLHGRVKDLRRLVRSR